MFGVTTSDDYRPVAWMGRYPVDVTTMLVGLHIALAVIGCVLFAAGTSVLPYLEFDSTRVFYQCPVFNRCKYSPITRGPIWPSSGRALPLRSSSLSCAAPAPS